MVTQCFFYIAGLCLERPGCECVPKKTRLVKINIVMGVNSSSTLQVCSSIDIEEHRGPCRCKCLIKSCHYNKVFNRDSCQCMCKDTFAVLKRDCLINGGGRATNFWDEETCSCKSSYSNQFYINIFGKNYAHEHMIEHLYQQIFVWENTHPISDIINIYGRFC